MRKFSPFLKTPKPEIAQIGSAETGVIHLLKKNGLSPNENPVDIQKAAKQQAQLTALIFESVVAYSEAHNISQSEAREIVLASKPTVSAVDYLSPISKDRYMLLLDEIVANYQKAEALTEKEAKTTVYQALLPQISNAAVNPLEYLSAESRERYLMLIDTTRDLPIKAATLMIQYRVLQAVNLVEKVDALATTLQIEPINAQFQRGDRLRFGNVTVTIDLPVDFGESTVTIKECPGAIPQNTVGYLLDFETNDYVKGIADWTETDTRNLLLQPQIAALYQFFQAENGEVKTDAADKSKVEQTPAESLGNSATVSKAFTSTPPVATSNGLTFIGDSNTTESPTNGSIVPTLETSPIG